MRLGNPQSSQTSQTFVRSLLRLTCVFEPSQTLSSNIPYCYGEPVCGILLATWIDRALRADAYSKRLQQSSATLKDVAREAGVNVSTASRALAGGYGVHRTTRARVMA